MMYPKRLITAVLTLLLIALFASGLPAQRQRRGGEPAPDVIYYNAKVVTVDERFSYAQAIAITGDKFSAVGTNESRAGSRVRTRARSIPRQTVIPGLADGHLHNAGGGPGVDSRAPERSMTC